MKLTLDKSWELCLKQWRWIAKRIRAGGGHSVHAFKGKWCKENGFGDISAWCFFCEYQEQHPSTNEDICNCPAKKIDKTFICDNSEYSYNRKPLKFYAKLLELNRKRKKK